jgi:hypothetical protein
MQSSRCCRHEGRFFLGYALVIVSAANAVAASGATPAKVSGSTALAVAGVIAPLSPDLSGAEPGQISRA